MSLFKDLALAAMSAKALKQSDRPGVVAPPGYTVVGMKHEGIAGSRWKITYVKDSLPNSKFHFRIHRATRTVSRGAATFTIHWS